VFLLVEHASGGFVGYGFVKLFGVLVDGMVIPFVASSIAKELTTLSVR